MKNLKEYIFELNDETYLNAAKKLKLKNKDNQADKLIEHSKNILIRNFLTELTNFSWFDDSCKIERCYSNLEEYELRFTSITRVTQLDKSIKDDIINLCKKYDNLIHGIFFREYINEYVFVRIYFLHRNKPTKINSNTNLYHITKEKYIKQIEQNGLLINNSQGWGQDNYLYKALFALKSKSDIRKMLKQLKKSEKYYLVTFKAGDNLWFIDELEKRDDINSSIYTLENVPSENIIDITEI